VCCLLPALNRWSRTPGRRRNSSKNMRANFFGHAGFTPAYAGGEWLVVTRYSSWEAFGKAQEGLAKDPAWAKLDRKYSGISQLMAAISTSALSADNIIIATPPPIHARRVFLGHSTSRITLRRFVRSSACTTSFLSSSISKRSTVRIASCGPGSINSLRMRLPSSMARIRMRMSWSGLFISVRNFLDAANLPNW